MSDLKKILTELLINSLLSIDLEQIEEVAEKVYDQFILPTNLPKPNGASDPQARAWFVSAVVAIVKQLRNQQLLDREIS